MKEVTEMGSKFDLDKEVLELVASGRATTRAELARTLNIAPSTASSSITRLITERLLREEGELESTGGRRARKLVWCDTKQRSLAIEFGANHARLALVDVDGVVSDARSVEIDISQNPITVLESTFEEAAKQAAKESVKLNAVGIGLPGPVDPDSGTVIGPSRMPGWNKVNVRALAQKISGLPVLVENDARLGAKGESSFRKNSHKTSFQDFIYVKAGSAIGGALVLDGKVQAGSKGLGGDLTHVPIPAAGERPCSCGNRGCLDTVASAQALRTELSSNGRLFQDNDSMLVAALDGDPEVVNAVREAGILLGSSLAHVVAFLNPEAVIIGGTLSAIEAFQAGIRQSLHELCLPSVMESLTVESAKSARDAALWGLAEDMKLLTPSTTSTFK